MKPKEIVIGGAQFGSKYGITNKNRFNENNVKNNIKLLKTKNINCFDTSNLYKKSNQIIGNLNYEDSNKYYAKFYIDKHRFEISNWKI